MNTHKLIERKRSAKLIALLLTAAVVLTSVLAQLGTALAAPADINVTLTNQTGIPVARTVEVGQTQTSQATSLHIANSADPTIAMVTYIRGNPGTLNIRGVRAGVVGVALGTFGGASFVANYLVINPNNISAYTLRQGGEVVFAGPGQTKSSPVTVTAGNFNTITWRSLNTDVATVTATGDITSTGIGSAIILGEFIDRWGVPRDMHILVGVGVGGGDPDLNELIELINRGEWLLSDTDSPYTADSLNNLLTRVNAGKVVLNTNFPTTAAIQTAVNNLKSAFDSLVKKATGNPDVILGPDGNYYLPMGDPANVYMIVTQNGSPRDQPPKYVYNPNGTPGTSSDRPAYMGSDFDNVLYYVEEPPNIFKRVLSNGTLDNEPNKLNMIWGGPDGKLGGGDDMWAGLYGTGANQGYWVHVGQNVFKQYSPQTPRVLREPPIGGGFAENPTMPGVTPIFLQNGRYYVGPLMGADGEQFFYGDSWDPARGDGKLNSEAGRQHYTDDIFKLNNQGVLVPWDADGIRSVSVMPQTLNIQKGQSYMFLAQIARNDTSLPIINGPVTWTLSPTSAQTTINSSGFLSVGALETNTTFTVRATSTLDPTKFGTATVNVTDATDVMSVTVSPQNATVGRGATQLYTATVTLVSGTDTQGVTWSVNSTNPATSINTNGLLTVAANEANGQLIVTAKSNRDNITTGTATLIVGENPTAINRVEVTPKTPQGYLGGTVQFSARVWHNNGTENFQGVAWTVSSANVGTTISTSGLLTIAANETASTLIVTARSIADNTKFDTASVTVTVNPLGIREVIIEPASVNTGRGMAVTFTGRAVQNNGATNSEGVSWTVNSSNSGTTIDSNGRLVIAANETANQLIVTATSRNDTSKSATAIVNLNQPGAEDVERVVVTPANQVVYRGSTQNYTARVWLYNGTENFQGVTWSVNSTHPGTTISTSGVLTIAANEPAVTLTITARANKDNVTTGSTTAIVTNNPIAISHVEVYPANPTVDRGGRQTFTAFVYQNNGQLNTGGVVWTVSPASGGTSINTVTGELTVGANDTNTVLTVRATSVTDPTKSGTATVTLRGSGGGTPGGPIVPVPTPVDGRILENNLTGDGRWVEIARNGSYSLIVRAYYINGSVNYGSNNNYNGSNVQTYINNWFNNMSQGSGQIDRLSASARLRSFTVANNAVNVRGTAGQPSSLHDGYSVPTNTLASMGSNIAFAMSWGEAANFCSKRYFLRTGSLNSTAVAISNYGKVSIPTGYLYGMWLRTPGDITGTAGALTNNDDNGRVFQMWISPNYVSPPTPERGFVYPAVWVHQDIFDANKSSPTIGP